MARYKQIGNERIQLTAEEEAVLNAKYSSYSLSGEAAIKGFGVAHEGERGKEGLAIGETELIINSDIGEKFTGSVTAAIVRPP